LPDFFLVKQKVFRVLAGTIERRGDRDLNIVSWGHDSGHGKVDVVFESIEGSEIHR